MSGSETISISGTLERFRSTKLRFSAAEWIFFPASSSMLLEVVLLTACALGCADVARAGALAVDTVETSGGPLRIVCIGHASLRFEYRASVLYVDPYGKVGEYASMCAAAADPRFGRTFSPGWR